MTQPGTRQTRRLTTLLLAVMAAAWASLAVAVPPVLSDVEVADVTPSSVTLIWDVDLPNTSNSVRIFADAAANSELTTAFEITQAPLSAGDPAAADEQANLASREALRAASASKGLARVRIDGLTPSTTYYLRATSTDAGDTTELPAGSTIAVTTANLNSFLSRSQQLRLRFLHPDPDGWVVMATSPATQFPVSSVVGDGAAADEAFLNLGQMFETATTNWEPVGETTITIRIREGGGTISTPSFDVTFIDGFAVGISYPIDVADPGALLQIIQPASLTYTEGETIVLAWVDNLPPSSLIDLYFDTDNSGEDGTQIVAGLDADADGAADTYDWDTVAVPDGIYWVYAQGAGSSAYAPAPVAIDRAGTDGDTDTMADLWEQLFFGSLANDGTADGDFDNRIDSVEFADRTSPVEPDFRLRGVAGLNLVSWPIAPANSLTSADLVNQLAGVALSVARVDNATQLTETTTWDGAAATGAVFPINAEEGLMLRLSAAFDAVYAGTVSPAAANLGVGVNLVGFDSLPAGYSAYTLLAALGGESVVASVGRLDAITGTFESATYAAGSPVGFDFAVEQGAAYFIHLNQPVSSFDP